MAQGDYVVIDLEKNDDRITFILHESFTIHLTRMNVKLEVQMHVASISRRNSKTTRAMHLGQVSGLDVS